MTFVQRLQLVCCSTLVVSFTACLNAAHRNAGQLKDDALSSAAAAGLPEITTLAGKNGDVPGYADGAGQNAKFNFPEGMVLTPDGATLYVADGRNHALRQVSVAGGQVTTVAGWPPNGGGPRTGSADGVGTAGHLFLPRSMTMDAAGENIYLTDTGNFAIRKFNIATRKLSTVAGGAAGTADGRGTSAQFGDTTKRELWAGGLALDESDQSHPVMYIADSANQTIRRLDLNSGDVTTIGGVPRHNGSRDGPAAQALFNKPNQIQLDGRGGLFIGESDNIDLRKLDLASMTVTTVAGKAPADPRLVCDDANPNFRAGEDPTLWQPPECGATDAAVGTDARFRFPYGLALDDSGQFLFVVDAHNDLIRRFELATTAVSTIAGVQAIVTNDHSQGSRDSTPTRSGTFSHPANVVFQAPNVLYITDRSASCVRKVVLPSP